MHKASSLPHASTMLANSSISRSRRIIRSPPTMSPNSPGKSWSPEPERANGCAGLTESGCKSDGLTGQKKHKKKRAFQRARGFSQQHQSGFQTQILKRVDRALIVKIRQQPVL